MLQEESQMVAERLQAETATAASLLQMALSTIPNESIDRSFTKDANMRFSRVLTGMAGG